MPFNWHSGCHVGALFTLLHDYLIFKDAIYNLRCNAIGYQEEPEICSDGRGGAIIVWRDKRTGYYDSYAQRVDSNGNTDTDSD